MKIVGSIRRKMDIVVIMLIVIFLLVYILSVCFCLFDNKYDIADEKKGTTIDENPDVFQTIDTVCEGISTYWEQHLARKGATTIDNLYTYFTTCIVDSNGAVMGKEKWLYYKHDGFVDDFAGTDEFSREEIEGIKKYVMGIQQYCINHGASFSVIYGPNKQSVYPEYMPEEFLYGGRTKTDKLFDFLEQSNINTVNPVPILKAYKDRYPMYYRYDTHWNQLGAYATVSQILEKLGLDSIELEKCRIDSEPLRHSYHKSALDDLAQFCGLRSTVCRDEIEYRVEGTVVPDWNLLLGKENYVLYHNESAPNKARCLLYGDSFRVAMIPSLLSSFSEVYVNVDGEFTDVFDEIQPDYVIYEKVERNWGEYLE